MMAAIYNDTRLMALGGIKDAMPKKGNVTWSELRLLAGMGGVIATVIFAYTSLTTQLALNKASQDQIAQVQQQEGTKLTDLDEKYQHIAIDMAQVKQVILDNQASGHLSQAIPKPTSAPISGLALSTIRQLPNNPIAAESAQPSSTTTINYNNSSTLEEQPTPMPTPQPQPTPTPQPPAGNLFISPVQGIIQTLSGI